MMEVDDEYDEVEESESMYESKDMRRVSRCSSTCTCCFPNPMELTEERSVDDAHCG